MLVLYAARVHSNIYNNNNNNNIPPDYLFELTYMTLIIMNIMPVHMYN